MRSIFLSALLGLGILGFSAPQARASWLSQALHVITGTDGPAPGAYYNDRNYDYGGYRPAAPYYGNGAYVPVPSRSYYAPPTYYRDRGGYNTPSRDYYAPSRYDRRYYPEPRYVQPYPYSRHR